MREEFVAPVIDLTSVTVPTLTFDVAFNYTKYTSPYFIPDTVFADTLEISISKDCGETYEVIYKKGGADLATFDDPKINPLNILSVFINPQEENWRKEMVDLSAYSNATEATIKFSYISGMGGSINIDNIAFDEVTSIDESSKKQAFHLYPNPAQDHFTLEFAEPGFRTVNFYNTSGKRLFSKGVNGQEQFTISTVEFVPGVYFVEVVSDGKVEVIKMIIQ